MRMAKCHRAHHYGGHEPNSGCSHSHPTSITNNNAEHHSDARCFPDGGHANRRST